ncbi:MAG: UvrD-helicase domain-containing protein, partial [Spirochaetaceae bacterium]|nr:UvrD-helicase domain-containing protein [Spirochaetaceae bacterium]
MNDNFAYLDILEKKLDKSQRAACCRNLNTVVAAGAGSGKTQVLATRFAWLVMSGGIKVDEILALTFTKQAASEIYQRIYKTLGQFAANAQTPPEEKARAKQALKDFNKAHIQTLDSYSSTVVRQAANRYGINPKFSAGDASDIKAEAFRFLVKHKDEPALLAIAKHGKLQNLAQELFAYAIKQYTDITCSSTFFEEKLPLQSREIAAVWNKLSGADGSLASILDEVKGEYYREENAEKCKGEYFIRVKAFIDGEPELPEIEDISIFETDYETLSSQVSAISQWTELFIFNQKTKGATKELLAINKRFKEIKTVFDSLVSFILNYQYIKRIFEMLDEFMEQINEEKRKSGSLSFGDVNALALKILKEQKEIRNQEKKSFKKIMIDEFQDNNGKNRDMLYLLAEKDGAFTDPALNEKDFQKQLVQNLADSKLYFVGDEKQSIYKFRGADVSVFNSLTEDLALTVPSETETKLYMTNNYRS